MRVHVPLFLIAVAVSSGGIFAQNAPPNPREQARASVSIFVTDAHGNAISAISEGDVSVEDEYKHPRPVIAVIHDSSPLRLGVVIDRSNSQRGSELYKAGVQGLNAFLSQVLQRDADKVFLEAFDTIADRPTAWMKADELGNVTLNLRTGGGSSLFDAIYLACNERLGHDSSPARRVLVVLSDGHDNQSRVNLNAAIAAAQRAKTAVIAISTHENMYRESGADRVLKRLAEDTGGYAFLNVTTPKEMPKVFSQIAHQLDSMFQVVYVPVETAKNGEAQQLQIESASGKKLRVHAPKQYYAATP